MASLSLHRSPLARSAVALGIIVLAATVVAIPIPGGNQSQTPTYPLFDGPYWSANLTLTVPHGNNTSAVSSIGVGNAIYRFGYIHFSGLTTVLGYVFDGAGFQFGFEIDSSGPPRLDGNTTWGSPDGNSEVAWVGAGPDSATIRIETRVSQWHVAFESAPAPTACGPAGTQSVSFGGAVWSAALTGCGPIGGSTESWTAISASGANFIMYLPGGLVVTPCELGQTAFGYQLFPLRGVNCEGSFDPYATLGLSLGDQGPEMLSMSP